VLVEASAGGKIGIGYTYSHAAIAHLISDSFQPLLLGIDVFASGAAWQAMLWSVRNLGRAGLCATAIAAVDAALWDLKGRLLGVRDRQHGSRQHLPDWRIRTSAPI